MATPDDVRRICLALPEAVEKETWGHPTFRVRDKMFAAMGAEEPASVTFKADPDERTALLAIGDPWFVPAYVGRYNWLGLHLGPEIDVAELTELLVESWRRTAPKRAVAQHDSEG